jgi:hypothetical protein
MSATADSSCGELSEALQRNGKHVGRFSNIFDLSAAIGPQMIRDSSPAIAGSE